MLPETLLRHRMARRDRGYPSDAVTAIPGGNFRRAAGQSWASAAR
jgi:membrane dipeptidase